MWWISTGIMSVMLSRLSWRSLSFRSPTSTFPSLLSSNTPLTNATPSIAYGLITGIVTYIILNTLPWGIRKLTGRRISPPGYEDEREEWAIPEDGLVPLWMRKIARGDKRFWADDGEEDYVTRNEEGQGQGSVRSRKSFEGVESGKGSEEGEKSKALV
jgi:hypothetical protein